MIYDEDYIVSRTVLTEAGCWEWTRGKVPGGYGSVRSAPERMAHRLAYRIFKGSPVGLVIRHTCDNPPCCNPAHLIGGTHLDNRRDAIAKGRWNGIEVNRAKMISDEVIKGVLLRIREGHSVSSIAKIYGIHRWSVWQIKRKHSKSLTTSRTIPMNHPNFGAILDTPSNEVERPKPLPVGTYACVVSGLPRMDKSSKKQTEFVEFQLKPLQAQDDVDKEALEEMGGFSERTIRATYYITEDAIWRLKKFLVEDLKIDEEEKTLRQLIAEAPGQQVLAFVKHQASDDGLSVYAQLASTAPVE